MNAGNTVLDSSAVLAHFFNESGAQNVETALVAGAIVSAACWSEIKQKITARGNSWTEARRTLNAFNVQTEPVTQADAEHAADLWQPGLGLSLTDRLCLALGQRLNAEILTADTAWAGMPGVTVIR